jgi:hypothetical protein
MQDWLDHALEKQAAEDAELAARPDAAQIGATLQNALNGALDRERMWKGQGDDLRKKVEELERRGAARGSGHPASRETQA